MTDDANRLKRLIVDALKAERWDEALPLLEGWCGSFPNHASSWLNRGYCLFRLDRYREAVDAFDRCLALDPSHAKARTWRDRAAGAVAAAPPAFSATAAESPPVDPPAAQPTYATIAIPDSGRGWRPGTVVAGRYEIRAVERGGMAVVSIAFDRELQRVVAVKTPLPSVLATADGRARFQREAESWIALGIHPNICCAYYLQEIEGMPRLFVEYVDGGDLVQWLRQRDPPNLESRLDIAIQVASGLDYTHSFVWSDDEGTEHRGVIHRDVKPANVLLTSDGVARVTDFGLVRVTGGSETDDNGDAEPPPEWVLPHTGRREDTVAASSWQTVTVEGGLVGTPPYMAPELWRQSQRGTVATDVYAFGCMLYEIFCGRRPFVQEADPASQTRQENLGGWMRLHMRGEPPDPREFAPDLPQRLAAVIRSCIAKKPAARPGSFAQLREWLVEVYAGVAGAPYPRPTPQRTQLLADSINNRGVSFVALNLLERASASFREALQVDPDHLEATYNRGLLEWRGEGLTDAELERRLTEAERTADPARAALLRARLRLLVDNPDGAEEVLRAHAAAGEPSLAVQRELGLAVLAQARVRGDGRAASEARELLAAVVHEGASDLVAVVGLAEACALSGDEGAAEDILGRARGLDAAVPHAMGEAAAVYLPGHVADRGLALQAPVQSLLTLADGRVVVRTVDGDGAIWNGSDPRASQRFSFGGPARAGRSMTVAGGTLVACLETGPLTLFDLGSCERLRNLRPHPGVAICVATAADGSAVATGGSDRCLRLWNLMTGECERSFQGHGAFVSSVAWHPSHNKVATASADGTARVWDLDQGRCERVLEGHRGPVCSVTFSADGMYAYSAGQDGSVGVWDLASGDLVRWLRGHNGAVTAIAVIDGTVVGGGEDGTVRLWDGASGHARRVMRLANPVQDLEPASDGGVWVGHGSTVSHLVLPAVDGARLPLALAETVVSGELAERELEFRRQLEAAAAAIAGGEMEGAIGALRRARSVPGYDHHAEALSLWNRVLAFYPKSAPRSVVEVARHDAGPGAVTACDLLPDGTIVAGCFDGRLRRFGSVSGLEMPDLAGDDQGVSATAVSCDGRLVAAGGRDGVIRLCDTVAGGVLRRIEGHSGSVTAVAFGPRGELLSAGEDRTLQLWPSDEAGLPELLASGGEAVLALAASADSRFMVSAGWDSEVTVWSLPRRQELRRMAGHEGPILAVAISPDCRVIASAGDDGTVRLWDLLGGRCFRVLAGHEGAVRKVVFTPDARFIMSAGKDATLRLWDVRTGAVGKVVEGHAGSITGLGVDRSGGAAVSAGSDSSVRRWFLDWEPEQPEQGGWDDRVRPFLEVFLRLREGPDAAAGPPTWAPAELAELLRDLENRGFGWLAPDRVERELQAIAHNRDLSRAEERRRTEELAVRRQREQRAAPVRRVLEMLTRNLGLKLAGAALVVILGVLGVASLRTPDDTGAVFNKVLKDEMAMLTRERGQRLQRGMVLAYQEGPTVSQAPCADDELSQYLDLALFAERGFDPPLDPGTPAPEASFRERYAAAVRCVGRLGDAAVVAPVLERAADALHPYRLEDLVSMLVRIGADAEPDLRVALEDHSETVRHLATLSLVFSDQPSATADLTAALDGDDVRSKEAASYALTELIVLGVIDDDAAFETVTRLCRSIDPRVRRNAVRALVLFERTGPAKNLLEEVLEDSDPEVKLAAENTREMIRSAKIQQIFGAN